MFFHTHAEHNASPTTPGAGDEGMLPRVLDGPRRGGTPCGPVDLRGLDFTLPSHDNPQRFPGTGIAARGLCPLIAPGKVAACSLSRPESSRRPKPPPLTRPAPSPRDQPDASRVGGPLGSRIPQPRLAAASPWRPVPRACRACGSRGPPFRAVRSTQKPAKTRSCGNRAYRGGRRWNPPLGKRRRNRRPQPDRAPGPEPGGRPYLGPATTPHQ